MFGLSDSDVTAWATVALAFVGVVGILTGIAVTVGTLRAAAAARKATELQAREIGVLETQTKLLQVQQEDARTSAFPWLQATITNAGELYVEGTVTYVSGSAPAWSTEVWVRTFRGYYQTPVGFVAPGASRPFRAVLHTDEDDLPCPFKEFKKLIGDEIGWVGVTWNGPSYWVGRQRWRLLQEGNRHVGERMWRSFDEEAEIEDSMREEAERRHESEAIDTLMPRTTDQQQTPLARLLRRGRRGQVKP
jgi:hypothetical protein